jgi:hypothetical protein
LETVAILRSSLVVLMHPVLLEDCVQFVAVGAIATAGVGEVTSLSKVAKAREQMLPTLVATWL